MKQLSGKHLCQLAEQEGWELKRINGSHPTPLLSTFGKEEGFVYCGSLAVFCR